jgi:cbb3-type cytochrome oxidase subunit 3
MAFPKSLNQLCTPSYVYFIISTLALTFAAIQNLGNTQMYALGNFSCRVPSTIAVFILKLVYILFWTWILNLMCKDGQQTIAWLLVLLPFILLFVILGTVILYQNDEKKNQKKSRKMDEGMRASGP